MSKPDETGAPLTDAAAQRPRAASRPRSPRGRARPAAKGFSVAAILGFSTALITLVLDQATKLYTLFVYDLPVKEPVKFAPFINLIVVWNRGISYGLFQQNSEIGRWGLIIISILAGTVVTALVVLALKRWAARKTVDTVETVPVSV